MHGLYTVVIEDFAERHFIKKFRKKYKQNWDLTEDAIRAMYERVDNLLEKKRANVICETDGVQIIKSEFAVVGSGVSAKTSGNRCIAVCLVEEKVVRILLVYNKNDLPGRNETTEWKRLIAGHYPEYRHLVS
ncbi:hypothetical protein H6778_01055 [Candidatus Nomurabacteria bacterium]|nr:hypothetical protein [Candidatus Nomurabacteria bacterium]